MSGIRKYLIAKRIIDVAISSILLVMLSPLLLIIGLFVKLSSKGPVFYKQIRPGKDQRMFEVYKFRTMVQDADKYQEKGVEVKNDDNRITVIGRFLRRYKIDELAQLINVLKGDMSLVGPRPTLPDYIDDYEEWELERFKVRPGMTGLAQVNGNIYLDRKERSAYDVFYVKKLSLWLDIKILIRTLAIVFFGESKFIKRDVITVEESTAGEKSGVHRIGAIQ